ncbi:tetratricopeptide repeat protein [Coraliomargarita sp. SDUM461004]|uniref:Tetratricopeptide repeat protein n=1 Tax=Thalassobacterium sedimentorum TaxID=3041258 RepID=A0ABU1AI84_9BACT|nr:tetratricopeptide repeat protein [Coraliomargarita sp. SDUM461004]MDQ8194525.1 tetratricopeptide repeat protein [Coraliomargarita sp. SDUM461004]
MTRNKKPVVIVAIVLAAFIFIPLLLLLATRLGGSSGSHFGGGTASTVQHETDVADFDLRQLASKVEQLVEQDLAAALRQGDVSLDFMSSLKRDVSQGQEAMQRGQLERASEYFTKALEVAESELSALALADQARMLNDSTYADLQRLEYLKSAFENTYREAVETYNTALRALNVGDYQASVNDFEMTGAILGDMEARAIQQIAGLLDTAQQSLEDYKLTAARNAYESVLKLDAANVAATEGLVMLTALEGIAEEVKAIRALEASGDFEEALAELERLAAENPQNPFIRSQRTSLEARILERDYQALLAASVAAEQAEDFSRAITSLEAALKLKSTAEQQARLANLQNKDKAVRLEVLLADGYDALRAGRYEAARMHYKEAVALAPDSKEARTGLEKASSLYLANIRYSQNVAAAAKYIKEGRYPLAAKLFNEAMSSRPSNVAPSQQAEEARIRASLQAQSEEVNVTIESDKRTYVSIIGVLPPDRFKTEELKLFPDVYKVRGTRSGYKSVEFEFKVDANKPNFTITVECTEKI